MLTYLGTNHAERRLLPAIDHHVVWAEHTTLDLFQASSSDERAVFRIDQSGACPWIVRALRRDAPIPEWLGGCGVTNAYDMLNSRAQTLVYLEQHAYPAPCVVPIVNGECVGEADGWCLLATTFVPGAVAQPTLDQLRLLGSALGRLHQLHPADNTVGKSWWYPEHAIPSALEQLAAVEHKTPAQWMPLHHAMRNTLETAQRWSTLPCSIVHGDAWAGNGIHTAPDQIVLIDWDASGLGWSIVDLGRLLIQSPVDVTSSLDDLIVPNIDRINAVVDGYYKERLPTQTEIEALPEAIRFTIAVGGAWHVAQGPIEGWDRVAQRLARRQHLYHISDSIAMLAQQCLTQIM